LRADRSARGSGGQARAASISLGDALVAGHSRFMALPFGSELAGPFGLIWALPFLGMLLTIALAPLVAPRLWHRHYGKAAAFWAAAFLVPDGMRTGGRATLASFLDMALHQYLPFMLLLGALFVIAGGLRLTGTPRATPAVNTALLAGGVVLASVIGTIGAAMLLLRPLLRANRHRAQPTHVFVFFIFLVANVGGALTPLGNAPLLLGYLKGVPFFWPAIHLALPTLVLTAGLLGTFYALDRMTQRRAREDGQRVMAEIEKLGIEGAVNLALLPVAILALMVKSLLPPSDGVEILGVPWSMADIAADALLVMAAGLSLALTRPATRQANAFAWEPLVEVAILFAVIFVTLIPVTEMMAAGLSGPAAPLFAQIYAGGTANNALYYRMTGLLSALLDNAPTYLMFFGLAGNDAAKLAGPFAGTLAAVSAGAAYFGGLTYIGNAPNLMVKAIVESQGLRMPSFFGYVGYAAVCLLPWLLVVEALFFH